MSFDFGLLQPYVDDLNVTDIDTNSKCVYITDHLHGKKKVLDLEIGYLENILLRLSNSPQINKEFNLNNPILEGTLDGVRIHGVHETAMDNKMCWLSIRRNPIELVVKRNEYKKIFELIEVANQLKWSYVFGGERGSGKTQWTRSCISMFDEDSSVAIIAENDEMHMLELLPERLISQYVINDVINYTGCVKSVLRDNSDYVIFQEVRDKAIDDLFLILSSSSRVLTTLHIKNALLMPQRMVQLSQQKNDEHLISTIHDFVQMCIVPVAEKQKDGSIRRYVKEIALFWNDENNQPKKQLIYEELGNKVIFYDLPIYYKNMLKQNALKLDWR